MLTEYLKKSDMEKQNGERQATKFETELINLIPTFQKELFADNSVILTLSDVKSILKYESKKFLAVYNGEKLSSDDIEMLRTLVKKNNSGYEANSQSQSARIAETTGFFS